MTGFRPPAVDGAVHGLEHLPVADIEPLDAQVAPQDRHRIDLRARAGQQADHGDASGDARRHERARQGAGAADLDRDVDAAAAGQLRDLLVPVGRGAIVDHRVRAHRFQSFGLGLRARRREHPGAGHPGELQGEDRHAARAQHEHGVARLDAADLHQRMPGGDGGAGQGGAFLEAQALRQTHHAVLLEHRELGQHAVDGAAHRRAEGGIVDRTAHPSLHEAAGDAIADLDPRHARSDRDHLARAVGQRDQVGLGGGARIVAFDGDQVAVVERRRAHAHQHLARTGRRLRPLDQRQRIDALGRGDD